MQRLLDEGLSVVVFDGECELYRSCLRGVRPLIELLDWFPSGLAGASVADRIVGSCAARILAHLRAAKVFALRGTTGAEHVLFAAGIEYEFVESVPSIRNRENTGPCPFEQLSALHPDTRDLITAMRVRLGK